MDRTCETCANCEETKSLFCGGTVLYCSKQCMQVCPGCTCEDWTKKEDKNERMD